MYSILSDYSQYLPTETKSTRSEDSARQLIPNVLTYLLFTVLEGKTYQTQAANHGRYPGPRSFLCQGDGGVDYRGWYW